MMPTAVRDGYMRNLCECVVIMSVRFFAAILTLFLATAPALAGVKSATDKIADAFMELDADQSNSVSYGEYKAMVDRRARSRFRHMDANRDGAVSDAEYRQFWRKNKAKWYRLKR